MSAMTSPLRMPSYFYNDLTSIVSSLAPLNKCHFAIAGYTPFSAEIVESVRFPLLLIHRRQQQQQPHPLIIHLLLSNEI